MERDKQLLGDGIALERKTVIEWLRNDQQLWNAIEYELSRQLFVNRAGARDIAELIADNLLGAEHWREHNPPSDLDLLKLEAAR